MLSKSFLKLGARLSTNFGKPLPITSLYSFNKYNFSNIDPSKVTGNIPEGIV